MMKVALFGGSFDPIHREHIRLVQAAKEALGLDLVLLMPSRIAPHKSGGASASGEDRLALCRAACKDLPYCEADDFELRQGGTSYTYLTCRAFSERFPDAERYFLVGADMLENFFSWRNPDEIVSLVQIAACGREEALPQALKAKFSARFHTQVMEIPFTGENVSSTALRVALAFRGVTDVDLTALDGEVLREIGVRGLYAYPNAKEALLLEKESRRAHSFRVALLACRRARSLGVQEHKALLSSMYHDCAKYLSQDDVRLRGLHLRGDIPAPVVHQFAGAYLAEHLFGEQDEEILDAVRYHASGREDMTTLGKLVYLADLLEPSRTFDGVEELRKLFWEDLDACLLRALEVQLRYLEAQDRPVYSLTRRAYEWLKRARNA